MVRTIMYSMAASLIVAFNVQACETCQPQPCAPATCQPQAQPDCAVVCPQPMTGILGWRAARAQNRYLNTVSRQQMIHKIKCAIREYRDNKCRVAFTSTCNMTPVPDPCCGATPPPCCGQAAVLPACNVCCKRPCCCLPAVQTPCVEMDPMKVPITIEAMVCIPSMQVPATIGIEQTEVQVTSEPVPTLAPPMPAE